MYILQLLLIVIVERQSRYLEKYFHVIKTRIGSIEH